MCDATGLSQRRACRLTGLSLSTCRYEVQRPAADAHLSGRITELALERRRFGYRRIWQLMRREGLHVNHKRVYRLYHRVIRRHQSLQHGGEMENVKVNKPTLLTDGCI